MKQPRAWQRMLSGRRLDLLDPTPVDIEIEDIAHGLAFVARWNGQTHGDHAYSVAEHSLLVEDLFTAMNPGVAIRWQLAALLHDAPEYVIGDMISPVKAAVGPDYRALDERLTTAVHLRFGLPASLPVPSSETRGKSTPIVVASLWLSWAPNRPLAAAGCRRSTRIRTSASAARAPRWTSDSAPSPKKGIGK